MKRVSLVACLALLSLAAPSVALAQEEVVGGAVDVVDTVAADDFETLWIGVFCLLGAVTALRLRNLAATAIAALLTSAVLYFTSQPEPEAAADAGRTRFALSPIVGPGTAALAAELQF